MTIIMYSFTLSILKASLYIEYICSIYLKYPIKTEIIKWLEKNHNAAVSYYVPISKHEY